MIKLLIESISNGLLAKGSIPFIPTLSKPPSGIMYFEMIESPLMVIIVVVTESSIVHPAVIESQ